MRQHYSFYKHEEEPRHLKQIPIKDKPPVYKPPHYIIEQRYANSPNIVISFNKQLDTVIKRGTYINLNTYIMFDIVMCEFLKNYNKRNVDETL